LQQPVVVNDETLVDGLGDQALQLVRASPSERVNFGQLGPTEWTSAYGFDKC
jgi:hypothetical protein